MASQRLRKTTRSTSLFSWPTVEAEAAASSLPPQPLPSLPSAWGKHQDTTSETAALDEMSSDPYSMTDADSLTGFFEEDPYPIQGGLEKLDLMDSSSSSSTAETFGEQQEDPSASTATPVNQQALYGQVEALMYGMNQFTINHRAALDLARKHPSDPVMIAVQALLHRDDDAANRLWAEANQRGISSKVEQGCGFVQALVGKMLEDGVGGVKKDCRGAEFFYTRAARNGNAAAQFFLGQFHVKACQYDKARHWLERSAKKGHARAQMHFGLLFEHGRVGMRGRCDHDRAKEWYQKATDQGDAKAACRLGFLVRKKNHETSLPEYSHFAKKPPATEFGTEHRDATSQVVDREHHIRKNNPTVPEQSASLDENEDVVAVKSQWLEEQGSSKKRRLEPSLDTGIDTPEVLDHQIDTIPNGADKTEPYFKSIDFSLGTQKSKEEALVHVEDSKGSNSKLYVQMESLLYGMNTIKVDQQAALALARQHPTDPVMICIQAMLQRDESAANLLWKRANELGISSLVELGGDLVQALVGQMLENGLGGVKANVRRAEFWYNQAAKRGNATAQFFLGLFHTKDGAYERARFWLERAAKQGHARAQMHFGLWFEHNHDYETAKFWYKRSVAQGDAKAKYRLDFVEGKMQQRQLVSAVSDVSTRRPTAMAANDPGAAELFTSITHPSTRTSMTSPATLAFVSNNTNQNGPQIQQISDGPMSVDVTASTHAFPTSIHTTFNQYEQTADKNSLICAPGTNAGEVVFAPDVIRPYCAVMGDKSTRGARLTTGTKVLREIKEWYKENRASYAESGKDSILFEDAMQRYFAKMATLFRDFPSTKLEREQTLLVKCTKKSLESDRVEKPSCFRYPTEKQCQYGTAKLPHAVLFFFDSRDPPKLDAEVTRYRRKLAARPDIRGKGRDYFQSYLDFCAATASQAAEGCPTAQLALESTNFIPAIKKLYDDLERFSDS